MEGGPQTHRRLHAEPLILSSFRCSREVSESWHLWQPRTASKNAPWGGEALPLRRCLPAPSGSNKMCEDPVDLSTFWIPFPIPSVPPPPSLSLSLLDYSLPHAGEKGFWTGAVQTGPSAFLSLKEWCISNAASYCSLSSTVTCLRKRRSPSPLPCFLGFPSRACQQ
ncbi:hypothetical protein VTI28DRAFT_2277 [Corynascus sepedonium]